MTSPTVAAFADVAARGTAIAAVSNNAILSSADGDNAIVLTKTMVPVVTIFRKLETSVTVWNYRLV